MGESTRFWLAGLLFPTAIVGCGAGEEVLIRCVDAEAPTLSWVLFQFDEGAETVRIESSLPMGERGQLETTEAEYRISVPVPRGSGVTNEIRVDRVAGSGQMLTMYASGDVVEGTFILTLDCERVREDERL